MEPKDASMALARVGEGAPLDAAGPSELKKSPWL
jgi:hypothetical protein